MPPEIETPNSSEPDPSLIGTDPNTQTQEPTTEEPKPEGEESPAPEPIVPLTAEDIKFPEGVQVDETLRDEFIGLLNDTEKTPTERAQALVDLQLKAAQAASEANSKAWSDVNEKWRNEVKADADVGGDNLQPTLGRIERLVTEYGSEELREVFNITGAGNNVHFIKFLDKVARQLTEPGPVQGSPRAGESTAAQRLFPSMK